MAKNSSSSGDRREAAREKARQIAEAQAKREKTAKRVLYSGIAVVVVGILVAVGFLVYEASKPATVPAAYSDGGITLVKGDGEPQAVGAKDAKEDLPADLPPYSDSGLADDVPVVTVYLDYQCPVCQGFEQENGTMLTNLVNDGTIALEYRPIAILDSQSGGNKYSTRSANMVACIADSRQDAEVVKTSQVLFDNQPEEGGDGMTDEQMLAYAEEAGVDTGAKLTSDPEQTVKSCTTEETFSKYVEQTTQDTLDSGVTGTPTVRINGKDSQSWQDSEAFATEILKAAGQIG